MENEVSYEVTTARNPKWANSEKNKINLEVQFKDLPEDWLDYTCNPLDACTEHSRYLYTQALNGVYGTVADYVEPTDADRWTPFFEDKVEVSNEGLVQLLLEKGVITDEEVDSILLETQDFQGFWRKATDTSNHQGGRWFGRT